MIWLSKKQENAPTQCNTYNKDGGGWNPDWNEWQHACRYRTHVILYIWATMDDCHCKNQRQKWYCKATTKMNHLSTYSGELFIMHEIGILSVIGLVPTWMQDYCSVLGQNKAMKWMFIKYSMGCQHKQN